MQRPKEMLPPALSGYKWNSGSLPHLITAPENLFLSTDLNLLSFIQAHHMRLDNDQWVNNGWTRAGVKPMASPGQLPMPGSAQGEAYLAAHTPLAIQYGSPYS